MDEPRVMNATSAGHPLNIPSLGTSDPTIKRLSVIATIELYQGIEIQLSVSVEASSRGILHFQRVKCNVLHHQVRVTPGFGLTIRHTEMAQGIHLTEPTLGMVKDWFAKRCQLMAPVASRQQETDENHPKNWRRWNSSVVYL
jgi:hypothetical protein